MKNSQPNPVIETFTEELTPLILHLPLLSLPQVTPAQLMARRQRYDVQMMDIPQTTPFPQTPMPSPALYTESLSVQVPFPTPQTDIASAAVPLVPLQPSPTPQLEFSQSLRAGVTVIPRSMIRHDEPTVVDALIACGTLLLLGLFVLLLLYYFSV
jgi:hypothetical protein